MSEDDNGLVCAFLRAPEGSWREVGWSEVRDWKPDHGLLWIHLDGNVSGTRDYLRDVSGIDIIAQDALLVEETRPRVLTMGDGLLAILRGVNLNPGAEPDDMVSLRLWVEPARMITTRLRKLVAIADLRDELLTGKGSDSIAELFVQVVARLVDRMSNVIETLDDEADRLEDEVIEAQSREIRTELAHVRRQAIALRRYLAPQRDALTRLQSEELDWLDKRCKARLREVTDRVIRYVEDLDEVRERTAVIQDELMNRLSDQMNNNMYLLTIVAAIMLPLGFITGLLGVNVDGIPGSADTPWAFLAVCIMMAAIVGGEIWVLRRLRWF